MNDRDAVLSALRAAGLDDGAVLALSLAEDQGLRAWLGASHHGEMKYLERHLAAREDPEAAFPRFRSVAIAALEYGEVAPAPSDPEVGNISRYALGADYHLVLKDRLRRAADLLLARFPTLHTRILIDASPLNEKLIAARGGLGWVGKNTNLIQQGRGSYLFLGAILLSMEFEPGPARVAKDRCGLCDACLQVCPTQAFVGPYVLDARRCISYLTIELKGPIPRHLRRLIGNRIFGCDDCQEVCPWNRFAKRVPEPDFAPRGARRTRTLPEWLQLSEDDFRAEFGGSALERTGHIGFLRNVLVSLGCAATREAEAAVRTVLESSVPLLRGHAAWALGECRSVEARASLLFRLAREDDAYVLEELRAALEVIAGALL